MVSGLVGGANSFNEEGTAGLVVGRSNLGGAYSLSLNKKTLNYIKKCSKSNNDSSDCSSN